MRQRRMSGAQYADQVHVDHARQRFNIGNAHRSVTRDTGVRDHNVDAAKCCDGAAHGRVEHGLIGHVALKPDVAVAQLDGERA